jgi:hypothetical protein
LAEKAGTLTALHAEFQRWDTLLSGLSEAQATAPLLDDGWSLKDVAAHLHAWQQRSIARLEAARQGRDPAYPAWSAQLDPEQEEQLHDLNQWLYDQSRDQPWPQVYHAWREGFLRFLELGEAIPEADLLAQDYYPWLEGYALIAVLEGSLEHHREHTEFLAPVLDTILQQP